MVARLGAVHPVLMVRDVAAALSFYRGLGFTPTFQDSEELPRYAVLQRDGVELHLQWHDASEWAHGGDRPTYRFIVREVDALFEEMGVAQRRLDATGVMDTAWGTREFHVRDPDGNGLQFYWPS
jgi:catechol 2,3-dioxygenase-like lactoylglutathione lyase family enzyme